MKAWHKMDMFRLVRPPLRPTQQDCQKIQRIIHQHPSDKPRVLLLGVTQGLASLDFKGGSLLAVDGMKDMIDKEWIGNVPNKRTVLHANWLELAQASEHLAAFDIVLGDGSFAALGGGVPQQADLWKVAAQLLKPSPDSLVATRHFAPLVDSKDTLASIQEQANAGKIGTEGIYRFRLGMALRDKDTHQIDLSGIAAVVAQACNNDLEGFVKRAGWPETAVAYLSNTAMPRVTFSPKEVMVELANNVGFGLREVYVGDYEMAEVAPTMVFGRT
eukprot:TRINITY_DN47900_c0_g1_i1.p1 TRINITY_DN47900_c0_g1~~TRINITY_DN47900_c0_g1_i1.p1  ORF type:complete len:280 (-),score=21.05 TRINITY_DN47900_c0_g1_i1:76-894(-)